MLCGQGRELRHLFGERNKNQSEPEPSDFDCSNGGGERNSKMDDLSFGNTMLKQIKKRCKTKKRKLLNSVDLNEETMEICSNVKHEFPNFQHKDNEYDLEETLISWKSKLSKNMKSKRKIVSASSANVMSIIKSEQVNTDEDYCTQTGIGLCLLMLKLRFLSLVPECQTISSVASVSDFHCSEQVDSILAVSNEAPETTNVHSLETEVPYPKKETQYCSLNGVSNEYIETLGPQFDVGVSSWEIVKIDSPEIISYEDSNLPEFKKEDYIINPLLCDVFSEPLCLIQDDSYATHGICQSNSPKHEIPWQTSSYSLIQVPETTIPCGLETGVSLHPIKEPLCGIEDVPTFGTRYSGWEIVKVDNPEIINNQCLDLQEFVKDGYNLCPLAYNVSTGSKSPSKDHNRDLHDTLKSNSSECGVAWQTSNYGPIEVLEMDSDNSLLCLENINEVSACSFESRSRHGWPSNIRNIAISSSSDSLCLSSSCLDPPKHSASVSSESPLTGKQSLPPVSRAPNSFGAYDEPMASPQPQDYLQMKQQHGPKRLLSSRKGISPTSQETLCRAMKLTRLDE